MPYGTKFSTRLEKVDWLGQNQLATCKLLVKVDDLKNFERRAEYARALHFKMARAGLLSPKTYWKDVNWKEYCALAVKKWERV